MTTFDGDNLIITLTAGGAIHTVDAQVDLYSDWKEWVKLPGNAKYPKAFDTDGGSPLVGSIDQGSYYFCRNDLGWRIRPAEEDSNISFIGNLIPRDASLPMVIPTIGNFTVLINGLQPITQSVDRLVTDQQSTSYDGQVTIDTINGVSGTQHPVGTKTRPVNNMADAVTIASNEGITEFGLKAGTVALTQTFDSYSFVGLGSVKNCVIQLNNQNVDNSLFNGVLLNGTGSGDIEAIRCQIDAVIGLTGTYRSCGFLNNMTLGVGSTNFHQCFSEVNGNSKVWVSLNGGLSNFGNRDWIGGFDLRGVSSASAAVSIDAPAGRILIDVSCTNGEVVLGGTASLTDNSGALCDVIDTSLMSPEKQHRILKATAYRQYTNPTNGNLELYDDDDVLDQSVPIFEDDGTTAWDGVGPIRRRDKVT